MSKWHNPVSTWLPLRDLRAASLTVLCYQTKSAPMRSPCVLHSPRLAISRSPSLPRIPASLLRRLSSPTLCSQTRRPNTCLQLVLRRPAAGPGPAGGGDVRCGGAASGLHSLQLNPRLRPARRQPAVNPPSTRHLRPRLQFPRHHRAPDPRGAGTMSSSFEKSVKGATKIKVRHD